jgi:hypothetical protein
VPEKGVKKEKFVYRIFFLQKKWSHSSVAQKWKILPPPTCLESSSVREAANILNKQSQTADEGWSSSFGVGRGANNSSPKRISLLQKFIRNVRPGQITWINDLSERKW